MKRQAFTLVELLVSLAIFSVVGAAMIGLLNQATNLYQGANEARRSSESAMLFFNQWQDDLAHRVPISNGGLFWNMGLASGNSLVAWTIQADSLGEMNATQSTTTSISNAAKDKLLGPLLPIVVWWVDEFDSQGHYQPALKRSVFTSLADIAQFHIAWYDDANGREDHQFIQRLVDPNGDPSLAPNKMNGLPALRNAANHKTFVDNCAWFQIASLGLANSTHKPAEMPDLEAADHNDPLDPDRRWRAVTLKTGTDQTDYDSAPPPNVVHSGYYPDFSQGIGNWLSAEPHALRVELLITGRPANLRPPYPNASSRNAVTIQLAGLGRQAIVPGSMIVLSNDDYGCELAMVTNVTADRAITIEREQFYSTPIKLDSPSVSVHIGRPFVQVTNLEY